VKDSIRFKLESVRDRFEEIAGLLADPDVISDQNQFRDLSKEYARVEPIVKLFAEFETLRDDIAAAEEMASDEDKEIRDMGQEELQGLTEQRDLLLLDLQKSLIPPDPYDDANVYLEVRAGTGGDEAAIFAGDLFRMYCKFAETMKWKVEILSEREGEHGGYKEIISRITGNSTYAKLKFESGAHRVQRVPTTESQGRIHTSAWPTCVLTLTVPPAPAVSTSTKRIQLCASRTCPPASSLSARTSARSTRTRHVRCRCCRHACTTRK
jgi:peptide chain release factor 1